MEQKCTLNKNCSNNHSSESIKTHVCVQTHGHRRADYQQAERAGTAVRVTGPRLRRLEFAEIVLVSFQEFADLPLNAL